MVVPKTHSEWKKLADDFWYLWNFPLCLGAIDGKHCAIICPPPSKSGSAFYNYKGSFSIVLMAVADPSYMFTFVDVGDYGRQSDSSVFGNSNLGQALNDGLLNIPEDGLLPNSGNKGKYCFIADEAFPLKDTLQCPYPGRNLSEMKKIYNYRLSRARRVVENAFGILSARWQFLRSPIQAQPEKAANSILASVALHNWLKKHEDSQKVYGKLYCPSGYVDYEDAHGIIHKWTWRSEVSESGALPELPNVGPNNGKCAEHYRMLMANFFCHQKANFFGSINT